MSKTKFFVKESSGEDRIGSLARRGFFGRVIRLLFLVLSAASGIFSGSIYAQGPVDGGFTGGVYDANKRPIAGATVTFTDVETRIPVATQTDENGRYSKNQLRPGNYLVEVSATGFLPPEKIEVGLFATQRIVVIPDFELKTTVGATVSGTPDPATTTAAVQTESRSILLEARRGGAFGSNEVTGLPLGGVTLVRSFDELAFLLPGVAPPPQAIGNSIGPGVGSGVGTSGQFSVNGLRSRANNFMVDGSDNNDEDIGVRRQGFFSLIPQPIESVREFQIITLLAPAQFGRNLGAQVNVLSKSGGRDFHGTLYGFFNSDALNARNYFDQVGSDTRLALQGRRRNGSFVNVLTNGSPVFVENTAGDEDSLTLFQGGGALGGPISRNMFFFVSGEGQILNASKETSFAVPTVEQRGFLGTGAEGIGLSATEIGFSTTVSGAYVLSLFPFPNNPSGLYERNTFTQVLPANARGRVLSGKYDYNFEIGAQQQFFTARYNYTDDWRDLPQVNGAVFSSLRPLTRTDNFSTFLTGNLTDDLSNVLRFSWGRTRLRFEENISYPGYLRPATTIRDANQRQFLLNNFSLFNETFPTFSPTGVLTPSATVNYLQDPFTTEELFGPVGQVNISGFSPLGVDVFNFPQQRVNNTYQIADTMSLTAGDHVFAFGADIRRTNLESDLPRNSRLSINSSGAFTTDAFRASALGTTLGIPALLAPIDLIAAGSATDVLQTLVMPGEDASIDLSFNQFNFFAQDDFRVSPNFSLSYGLRYELNTVPEEADGKIENSFPLAIGGLSQFVQGRDQIYDLDKNNFAPRFGFAYSPDQSTVIRGGYGIYYDQILGAVVSQSRNVFPRFSTLNFGGVSTTNLNISTPYNTLVGGQPLIRAGTLNTLNVTQQQLFGAVAGFPTPFGATIPQKELDTPYSHQYSFEIERRIFSDSVISAAYVGTAGRNLLRFTTPNLGRNNIVTVNSFSLLGFAPRFGGTIAAPGVASGGRPVSGFGPVDQFETTGRSRYDSLQIQMRGRLTPLDQRFQYQISYVFGSVRDDVSDVFELAGAPALPQNSRTLAGEYAAANFDVRHRFTYNFIYDLPGLNDQGALARFLLGGWQIAGTGKYNTGQPFTVNTIFDVNQDGNSTDRLNNTQFIQTTDSRQQPLVLTNNSAASLAAMLAPVRQDGAVSRNSFRAGSLLELDLSFNKRFSISESQNLNLRFDIFNFIDRANFGVPVRFLEAKNFGQAVETITPGRRLQIALKYIF